MFGVHRRQFVREGAALRLDFRSVAFLGVQGLLLAAEAVPAQHACDGREVTRDAQAVAQLRERGVGLLPNEFHESADGILIELGRRSARVGLGLDGAGGAASLQEADEEGQVDGEQVGNLAERVFAAINGRDDTFPEIVGVRTHGSTSLGGSPKSFYSVCYPGANRSKNTVLRLAVLAGQPAQQRHDELVGVSPQHPSSTVR